MTAAPSGERTSVADRRASRWDGSTPERLAADWGVPHVDTWDAITSTNDRAIALAREGAPHRTVVVADQQTAGRGRRGAEWLSPARSGLWMSVVLRREAVGGPLPLVVGVACVEAIRTCAPNVAVGIKWPNDLLTGGRKVGGILCEAADGAVVAGIGVNVTTPEGGFAEGVQSVATSLEANGSGPLVRRALAGAIVRALTECLESDDPFAAARATLVEADALFGRRIETEQAGPGWARGIDDTGALVLEREDGSRVRVISGSVRLADGRP